MIAIACSRCGAKLRVPEEMAGRRGKCRKCGAAVTVPDLAQPDASGQLTVSGSGVWPPGVASAGQQETRQSTVASSNASPTANSRPSSPTSADASDAARAPLATPVSTPTPAGAETVVSAGATTVNSPVKPPQAAGASGKTKPAKPVKPASASHEIILALNRHIEPVPTSLAYKASALLVFVVMLLLPLIYVAMIVGVGYAIYLHAVHDAWILSSAAGSGRGTIAVVGAYLTPIIVGGILILFMCKPLLARPARQEQPRSLTRRGEPLLFAFVEKLCESVGAPTPRRIDVDCQVNASASFRRGFLSMFGNDMVLTIGLPVAAGLNLRELAGVLAHEFGHFTQGWGMRLSYGIRKISFWFTRVVYERDAWDQRLVDWSTDSDWRLQIVLNLARLGVWLSRKVLWVLMIVGHAVSGVLLRQMEFDADLHEMRLAGSKAFESTCRRLAVLNVATSGAYDDLSNWYRESRLCDDLPRLIVAKIDQLPPQVRAAANEQIDRSTTGWLDTHPADSERIARAREAGLPGLFRDERPASELFADFAALSKTVTFDFYKTVLGPAVQISDLHPTDRLLDRQQREDKAARALARYLQGTYHTLRPLPFATGWFEAAQVPSATAARLRQARQQMIEAAPAYRQSWESYMQTDSRLIECEQASALLGANFKIKPTTFSQPLTAPPEVKRARARLLEGASQTTAQLESFEKAAVDRMTAAMELLHVPQVVAKLPNGENLAERCRELLCAVVAIRGTIDSLIELRNVHAATMLLVEHLQDNQQNAELVDAITERMKTLHRLIGDLRSRLTSVEYPFKHGKGKMSVASYCVESMPASEDLMGMLNAGSSLLDRLPTLLLRLMGQLAMVAEMVETAIGLPPLEEPEISQIATE